MNNWIPKEGSIPITNWIPIAAPPDPDEHPLVLAYTPDPGRRFITAPECLSECKATHWQPLPPPPEPEPPEPDLLPCPFCGNDAKLFKYTGEYIEYRVHCTNCTAQQIGFGDTAAKAIATATSQWNTRKEQPQ
jgi:hypothetical protein